MLTPKEFWSGNVASTGQDIYTVPAGYKAILKNLWMVNTGGGSTVFTIKVNGIVVAVKNGVGGGGNIKLRTFLVLNAGDVLRVESNAGGFWGHVSGALCQTGAVLPGNLTPVRFTLVAATTNGDQNLGDLTGGKQGIYKSVLFANNSGSTANRRLRIGAGVFWWADTSVAPFQFSQEDTDIVMDVGNNALTINSEGPSPATMTWAISGYTVG